MNNIRSVLISNRLLLGFIISGILALLLRGFFYSPESIPSGDSVWQLTMSVNVDATADHPAIYMAIPLDSANNRVISQTYIHPGLDIKRLFQRKNVNARELVAVAHDTGKLTLTSEYKIHISETRRWQKWFEGKEELKPTERMRFLKMPENLELEDEPLSGPLKSLLEKSQDQNLLIQEIFSFVHQQIRSDKHTAYISVERTLSQMRADSLGKSYVMVALCRASNIPARIIAGVIVQEMLGLSEHYWVEVYVDDHWQPYDPSAGYFGEIPATYLKLAENTANLAYQKNGLPLDVVIDMEQIPAPAGLMGTGKKQFRNIFDLTRLPVTTQFLLSSLLLLPLGGLITTVFRNIVGVQTYGTFKSSLLALSVIYADWLTVTVVVCLVTIIGIGGRSLLPEHMTRVPRLSIVLTIVAVAMVLSVSLMDFYNLNPTASVVLLPIIVMTSLVDRVYAIADEKGIAVAIYRLFWTCLVAVVCYMVFTIEVLRLFVIGHPEIHFFTLALILMSNAYKSKMLTAYTAFHWMREPKHSVTHSNDAAASDPEKKNILN
jgi:hypothetical protein